MLRIGIMQGRLVPKVDGRIQAFPRDDWRKEFALAKSIGFDAMELTIETASFEVHPLRTTQGRSEQARLAADNGIHLAGLCLDTVMEHPVVAADEAARQHGVAMTLALLRDSAAAGLPMIELPMMGPNSLKADGAQDRFRRSLDILLPAAEEDGIDVLIESDLPLAELGAFLVSIGHPRFGVNYDSGNSTWFGYEPEDELPVYGRFVRNIHVKDCTRADYSVPLGNGETRFDAVMDQLAALGYQGDFILQAARQDNDVAAATDYFAFTSALVNRLREG